MTSDNNDQTRVNRRTVLKSLGAAGAGASTGIGSSALSERGAQNARWADTYQDVEETQRTIEIQARDSGDYTFSVTGLLQPVDAPSDAVSSGAASASVSEDSHTYRFTGEFTEFRATDTVTVTVEGEQFDHETFPHNRVEIIPDGHTEFDISASGAVEPDTEATTRVNERRVTGSTAGERIVVNYSGELTYLDVDESARVLIDGTEINPADPLPSVESGRARIRSLGPEQEFALQLGWDVNVTPRAATINRTDWGLVEGTATTQTSSMVYSGAFQYLVAPGIGTVVNFPERDHLECIATDEHEVTFSVETADGSEQLHVESGRTDIVKLGGAVEAARIHSTGPESGGVELQLSPGASYERAKKSKTLQIAAALERDPLFAPLTAHAKARGNRIRRDVAGITAVHVRKNGDPRKQSIGDSNIVAKFSVTGTDGYDEMEIALGRNTTTGERMQAQLHHRHYTDRGKPDRVEVGELVTEQGQREQATAQQVLNLGEHPQISTTTTRTSDITGNLSDETVLYAGTLDLELNPSPQLSPTFWDPCEHDWLSGACDDAREAYEEGAKQAGKSADWLKNQTSNLINASTSVMSVENLQVLLEGGMTLTLNSIDALFDWGYKLDHYAGFTDKGAAAFNIGMKSLTGVTTFAMALADNDQINDCTTCKAAGRTALETGLSSGGTAVCTVVTGGVGILGCALFMNVLSSLAGEYSEDTAVEMACEQATLC